ncbi:hypothetical protein LP419_25490 [Massilia sp. H-1]|nr:hypothetical protein LP419_25490 [Massilia sp. H-1]
MINTTPDAAAMYGKLGENSVPVLVAQDRLIIGFNEADYAALAKAKRPLKGETMKKYLAVFLGVAALSAAVASEDKVDFKKCYKACMKEVNDKDKCTYICDDSNDGKSR